MTRVALAVDVGGTKVEAALVEESGRVHAGSRRRAETGREADAADLRAALGTVIAHAASALAEADEVAGVGIGSAGPIDRDGGIIVPFNLPKVGRFALKEAVASAAADALGREVPVVLGHDGGCLALAESWLGATRGAAASLSMVVSTGIGGGFVTGGVYAAGASGNAGHLGHVHTDGGELLEEVAAGPATVSWAQAQGWQGRSGEDLARSAASGDEIARAAIERSARLVGHALADAATLLDLDVIAIGGGFSFVADDYVVLVHQALLERAPHEYSRRTRVVRSALGGEGPLIGAAALILRD